jgi:HEAT repeat protein
MRRARQRRAGLLGLALASLCVASLANAEVPRELIDELGAIVDEAASSEDGDTRAWALRAQTLLGARTARPLLEAARENTDLLVRVFAGVGLLEIGRREGADVLVAELLNAGAASRQRILARYVAHLSEDDQVRVLEGALDGATDVAIVRDLVDHIARRGQGRTFALLERVANAEGALRAAYLEAVAASGRAEAADVVATLAASRDAAARRTAVELAEALGAASSRSILEGLLGDSDPGVAGAAALALAPIGVASAYSYLLDVARSGTPEEQARALAALRDGQPSLLDFDALREMLEGATDATVRRRLHEAIGATRSDEAFALLRGIAEGTVYEERLDALAGLGYTGRTEAAEILGGVLLGGGDAAVRALAAEALGHLASESAAAPLVTALSRERGGEVEVAAIRALATSQSAEALWPLAFQLSDSDDDVVLAVLETLEALGATQASSQIEATATGHRDPLVRWRATLTLFAIDPEVGAIRLNQALDRPPTGFLDDIEALPEGARAEAYERLLRHSNPEIRMQAIGRAMRGADNGLPLLRTQLGTTAASDMRQLAVATLTAWRLPEDLEHFMTMLDTSHAVMRAQSIEAVVELATPDAEPALRALLESTDLQRRVMAVYGLWKLASR